ncbi:hypothetical protein CRUP_000177 [Coryphaenoides rupestris]|nr:hypothetical protein CRUP_000177 [Coryphaenoides rupestris]
MEILDTVSGDLSASPSIVSLYEEKKDAASKPKKKFWRRGPEEHA